MKTRNESGSPQDSPQGLCETTRRELKRQLDDQVAELARSILGKGEDTRD